MSGFLATLLLLAVEAPLGPFARPGVPLALRSDATQTLSLDGWPCRVQAGVTSYAAPPRGRCTLRDSSGAEQLRFEEPPGDLLLVGVAGTPPAGFEIEGARVVPLDTAHLPDLWRAYDLFDRVIVLGAPDPRTREALALWARMGGSLLAVAGPEDYPSAAGGLGEAHFGDDLSGLLRAAGPPRPLRIPRAGNVRPDLYTLPAPAPPLEAARRARLLVLAFSTAAGFLLVLGASGRLARRALFGALAVLAASAAGLSWPVVHGMHRPVHRFEIEARWQEGGAARLRTYVVYELYKSYESHRVNDPGIPVLFRAAALDTPWHEEMFGGERRIYMLEGPAAPVRGSGDAPDGGLTRAEAPRWGRVERALGDARRVQFDLQR